MHLGKLARAHGCWLHACKLALQPWVARMPSPTYRLQTLYGSAAHLDRLSAHYAPTHASLHWAASAGHEHVCSALIEVGKRELVLVAARDGWTALFWAASSGLDGASLQMIAEGRKDLLLMRDARGQTALHRAAWRRGLDYAFARVFVSVCCAPWRDLIAPLCWRCLTSCLTSRASDAGRSVFSAGEKMEEVCLKMIEVGGRELADVADSDGRTG